MGVYKTNIRLCEFMSIQLVVALCLGCYYSCRFHLYLLSGDKKVSGVRKVSLLSLHMKLPEIQGQFHVIN
jgi:hypothetical protein